MGSRFRPYMLGHKLLWYRCLPICSRSCGSALFPWYVKHEITRFKSSRNAKLIMIGVLFYLSKWYTKKELNLRMSIFYSGSLISGAFGNLIAAGILSGLAGKRGISAW